MSYQTLIEEKRGGLLENVHAGVICGMNAEKDVVYQVGNMQHPTFYRSAAKLIQALPAFLARVDEKYGLTAEEAALFTASQRGECYHITALHSLQKKLNIDEALLFCPPSLALNQAPRDEMVRQNVEKRRLYHNCAGKHLGFLGTCRTLGYPEEGYWQVTHPLQQQILAILSSLAEIPVNEIHVAIDGCGVPVFALPLEKMALAHLKLTCPDLIEDEQLQQAVLRMSHVMAAAPHIVASTDFICSALLEDDNIIAKGGAKGVYCFGLKKERLSFALKVLDGSEDVWPNIIAAILEQINYANKTTIERIYALKPRIIKSDGGIEVGEVQAVFTLGRKQYVNN